jgi:hypothetical protein
MGDPEWVHGEKNDQRGALRTLHEQTAEPPALKQTASQKRTELVKDREKTGLSGGCISGNSMSDLNSLTAFRNHFGEVQEELQPCVAQGSRLSARFPRPSETYFVGSSDSRISDQECRGLAKE